MKTKALLIAITLLGCTTQALASPQSNAARASGEVNVAKDGRVSVQASSASVKISGGTGTQLKFSAVNDEGAAVDAVYVDSDQSGSTLAIRIIRNGRSKGSDPVVTIEVPPNATLESVLVDQGDATVEGLDTSARVTVRNGDARIANVAGADVRVDNGDAHVSAVSGRAFVSSTSGSVWVNGVAGDATCRVQSGDSTIENIDGFVEIYAASGDVTISTTKSDVLVKSISGEVVIRKAGGQVKASTASGGIEIVDPGNDVEANAASGDVSLSGPILERHRYFLKSLSGDVRFSVVGDVPGFRVVLSSYSGSIETDFPIVVDQPTHVTRRIVGHHGDGAAQVQLEAFSGAVQLLDANKKETKP